MLIFDAHLDLAFNGVDWNRDLRMSIAEIRAQEATLKMTDPGRGTNTVSFPELRAAGIGVGVATLFARQEQAIDHPFGCTTPEACYAVAMSHLHYYRAMERRGWMRPIRNRGELQQHLRDCKADAAGTPFGFILSMECADAVLDPDNIREWHELGLRAIGITHYGANRFGGGTRNETGLAADALPLLRNIEELGIALDLTHLSDPAFWQVADRFNGRVLASHQNARRFCDWQRQFSDEQVKMVIQRKGVLGMALDAVMLQPGWVRGTSKPEITLERVAENIDHICQLAGNCTNVGIGSDLDGGYGFEQTPSDLNTIADLRKIIELLAKRGYPATDIEAVMHGNWVRFFSEVLLFLKFARIMSKRYLIVGITAVAALWLYIDRVCFSTLADPIQKDLGLSNDQKGYILGAFFFTYALFQIPMGTLADRFGARKVLALSIAAWSLVTALTGFAQTFAALLAVRLMLGITESGAYPAAAGLIKSWARPEERGRFSSAVALGGRIGGALAPWLTAMLATILIGVAVVEWIHVPPESVNPPGPDEPPRRIGAACSSSTGYVGLRSRCCSG